MEMINVMGKLTIGPEHIGKGVVRTFDVDLVGYVHKNEENVPEKI